MIRQKLLICSIHLFSSILQQKQQHETTTTIPINNMEEQCVNFCIQYVHNSLPKMCYLVKSLKEILLSWDQHLNCFSKMSNIFSKQ